MIIKNLLVVQQEITDTKTGFLEKIDELIKLGYTEVNSRCYDTVNKLAEVTLQQNFNFEKVENLPELNEYLN